MVDLHAYRVPAPPAPQRFRLRMGAGARLGLFVSAAAITITVLLLVLTGRLFLLLLAAFGPGLYYLLSGAPRRLDVHHDAVVVRSWLRAARRLPADDLRVERGPDALVLASADRTITLAAQHFPGDSYERCARALRDVARGYVDHR